MESPARPGASLSDLWWLSSRRFEIAAPELIYYSVQLLGIQDLLKDPTSSGSIENADLDRAILGAVRLLRPGTGEPDFSSPEWRTGKSQMLQILSSIQQGTYSGGHNERASNSVSWTAVGGPEQRIGSAYHTPAETPASGIPRASSESRTLSINSIHAAASEDQQYQGSESAPFSPADSARSIRRRRSSSSMQNDKPGKRARGPQEHVCDVCQKRFPFLSKLKDHHKTHSTEKNLQCPYCRKSFKRNREVSAHLKSVHKLDQMQIHPLAPPSPTTPVYPATPASMGQAPTPGALSMLPPTPGPSGSIGPLPVPRPSPRPIGSFLNPYTPLPTPDHLGAPTPDYNEPDTPGFVPRMGPDGLDTKMKYGHSDDLSRAVNNIHLGTTDRYEENYTLAPLRLPDSPKPGNLNLKSPSPKSADSKSPTPKPIKSKSPSLEPPSSTTPSPEPVNPEPVNPEPANSEPVNPEPVNPEPSNPKPSPPPDLLDRSLSTPGPKLPSPKTDFPDPVDPGIKVEPLDDNQADSSAKRTSPGTDSNSSGGTARTDSTFGAYHAHTLMGNIEQP